MDCNEAKKLFSLRLDGEMNERDRELLQFHLQQCTSCLLELESWEHISSALREISKEELLAPPDFSSAVMQLVQQDQTIKKMPAYWQWTKTAKSGIAAAVLLLFATLAINTAPLLQVADKTGSPENAKSNYSTPKEQKQNNNSNTNSSKTDTINPDNSSTPSKVAVTLPDEGLSGKQIDSEIIDNASQSNPIFLNKERVLTTTMLKLKVADPSSAQTQASNMAKSSGAKTELLGQQTLSGQRFTVLKFIVAADKSNHLLSQLTSLGSQISYQEEKQDLTAHFSTTLEQYRNLLNQYAGTQDKDRLAQLDKQIASLEEQLSSWDKQAQEASIVLWLEE